jgi:hypothetical protein
VDTFASGVVGSVAGVVGAAAAIVFGLVPLVPDRRKAPGAAADDADDGGVAGRSGVLLPAPVLDVQVRGRDDVLAELAGLVSAPDGRVRVLAGMGGAGKSTVARAAAARITAGGGRAWWVPAGDAVPVTQLLLGLAGELGASPGLVDQAGRAGEPVRCAVAADRKHAGLAAGAGQRR